MPATHSHTFQRWYECTRCGFDYRIGELVRQEGSLVCIVRCVDVRDHRYEQKDEGSVYDEVRLPDSFDVW